MILRQLPITRLALIALLMVTTPNINAANYDQAKALIEESINEALETIKTDTSQTDNLVDKVVLPIFDFVKMSKLVLGKNWRKANRKQRILFIKEFRALLVRTYTTALIKEAKAGIKVSVSYDKPVKAGRKRCPDCIILKTHVKLNGKRPVKVDYAMYPNKKGQWKVYNVSVGGVSLVTTYRKEFYKDIKTMGINGLINKIKNQNRNKS